MICSNCGNEIPEDATVCPNCESVFEETAPAVAPAIIEEPAPKKEKKAKKAQTIDYSKLSKAQYKDAKVAYKAARKAAGKSRAPLVITCIVIALVLAGGSAFATWYLTNPKAVELEQANKELKEQVDKLTAENKELSEKLAKYEATEKQDNPLVGSWKVASFEATTQHYACNGGKAQQASVIINIKSVDEDKGSVVADLAVLYHGHDRNKLTADVDSSPEDAIIEFTDAQGTIKNGEFSFELTVDSKYGNNSGVVITGMLTGNGSAGSTLGFGKTETATTMKVVVMSYFQTLTNAITDEYTMKK